MNTPTTPRNLSNMSAAKKGPDFSNSDAPFVTITVGEESIKKSFVVHKDLISHHSPFFKAAFESSMIEGINQTMRLEDVEHDIFGMLVHWLYTGMIKHPEEQQISDDPADKIPGRPLCRSLIPYAETWALGQRFLMPKLQNSTIICLMEELSNKRTATTRPLIALADYVYAEQIGNHELRQLVVEKILYSVDHKEYFDYVVNQIPAEAVRDVLGSIGERFVTLNGGKSGAAPKAKNYFVKEDEVEQ